MLKRILIFIVFVIAWGLITGLVVYLISLIFEEEVAIMFGIPFFIGGILSYFGIKNY